MHYVIALIYLIQLQTVDAITNMKLQVIKDFDKFIKRLNIGYKEDPNMILHKISFIQSYQSFDKIDPIYQYLTNN